ncbi:MAG: hypothetical protein COB73_07285 [Flavobacteriaceae bacterium]|nr:MAG: hypothetical protein COB73_07285 [Flavobacteriaceae bacterium]
MLQLKTSSKKLIITKEERIKVGKGIKIMNEGWKTICIEDTIFRKMCAIEGCKLLIDGCKIVAKHKSGCRDLWRHIIEFHKKIVELDIYDKHTIIANLLGVVFNYSEENEKLNKKVKDLENKNEDLKAKYMILFEKYNKML